MHSVDKDFSTKIQHLQPSSTKSPAVLTFEGKTKVTNIPTAMTNAQQDASFGQSGQINQVGSHVSNGACSSSQDLARKYNNLRENPETEVSQSQRQLTPEDVIPTIKELNMCSTTASEKPVNSLPVNGAILSSPRRSSSTQFTSKTASGGDQPSPQPSWKRFVSERGHPFYATSSKNCTVTDSSAELSLPATTALDSRRGQNVGDIEAQPGTIDTTTTGVPGPAPPIPAVVAKDVAVGTSIGGVRIESTTAASHKRSVSSDFNLAAITDPGKSFTTSNDDMHDYKRRRLDASSPAFEGERKSHQEPPFGSKGTPNPKFGSAAQQSASRPKAKVEVCVQNRWGGWNEWLYGKLTENTIQSLFQHIAYSYNKRVDRILTVKCTFADVPDLNIARLLRKGQEDDLEELKNTIRNTLLETKFQGTFHIQLEPAEEVEIIDVDDWDM